MQSRIWAVLVGVAVVLLAMVALRPLLPIDETRYLSVAWEMWQSGDPAHLTKNGDMYTHKTPLLFVMINLVWLMTGVSEFAARLVGPACAVGMVAGTGVLARRFWPDISGVDLRAALMLAGFSVFLIYGSATMFDALLGLGVLGGVAALWQIGQGGGRRAWVGFGLALAFGVYAKGPVILVHLLPVLLTMRAWALKPPTFIEAAKGFALSLVVTLGLVALWLVPTLITATPEFRTELLWTQSAARVAGGMAHDRPFWFLAALLPLILFPWGWSWRLWAGIAGAWRVEPAVRLCVIWAGASLLMFSLISGKQVHYLLPTFPAMALLFGFASTKIVGKGGSLAGLPLLVLAAVAAAAGLGLIPLGADLAMLVPLWPLTAFAVVCAGLALLVWRLPMLPGHILAGAGLALGLHGVIATTGLYGAYDGQTIANRLALHAVDGLATTNAGYNAEFNFTARLTTRVATLQTVADLAQWATAHPNGLVFGLIKESPLTVPPQETFNYMGKDWGFWPATSLE